MPLADLDFKILHLIELRPTMPVKKIAERVGISWITANRHIEQLKASGILGDPIAVFDPMSLGLRRYVVLFNVTSESQLAALEDACDLHPYTHYRARIYGPFTGLFTQFDIPPESHLALSRFFSRLRELNLCDGFEVMRSTGHRASTHTNLKKFKLTNNRWHYDWSQWIAAIDSSSPDLGRIEMRSRPPALAPADLRILRRLTSNASVPQTEIQRECSLSQSSVSRKMLAVREKYIESIRAQIDRSVFDVTSTKLLYSATANERNRNRIFNAFLDRRAPPFPLSIDLMENGALTMWGRMPPSHEHHLYYALWKYLPDLQLFTMDTVGTHSTLYWFYPENYDTETGNWKTDEEWMVSAPLATLEQKMTS